MRLNLLAVAQLAWCNPSFDDLSQKLKLIRSTRNVALGDYEQVFFPVFSSNVDFIHFLYVD